MPDARGAGRIASIGHTKEGTMTIDKWMPLRELDSMERRMRRLFEDAGFAPPLLPAADVYETADEFVVELEVPGYAEKELDVEVSDHTLTIKGEQTTTKQEKEKTFRLHERLEREFERRFPLPVEADTARLKATFDKGVLKIEAPKVAAAKPKKVSIAAS
jgi:HSP20 family protein